VPWCRRPAAQAASTPSTASDGFNGFGSFDGFDSSFSIHSFHAAIQQRSDVGAADRQFPQFLAQQPPDVYGFSINVYLLPIITRKKPSSAGPRPD
jgi:hypothetical protein